MALPDKTPARFMRTEAAAAYAGLGKSTLEKLRMTGGGPAYASLGRVVIYEDVDLDEWIAERKRRSTSERPNSTP